MLHIILEFMVPLLKVAIKWGFKRKNICVFEMVILNNWCEQDASDAPQNVDEVIEDIEHLLNM